MPNTNYFPGRLTRTAGVRTEYVSEVRAISAAGTIRRRGEPTRNTGYATIPLPDRRSRTPVAVCLARNWTDEFRRVDFVKRRWNTGTLKCDMVYYVSRLIHEGTGEAKKKKILFD